MHVRLRDLKPNRFRDFAVDPVDEEQVAALTESIRENKFWGGVACRELKDGSIEVAAGWHRVKAAIAAGVTHAELYVAKPGKMSDHDMIRIYVTENATHRGEHGTALAGSVATAIKFIARAILTENWSPFGEQFSTAQKGHLKHRLSSANDGVGAPIILDFLHDIPGISKRTVTDQIANLKTSGIYDRLIGEVQAELAAIEKVEREAAAKAEAERQAAVEAAERARVERKAADEQRAREREQERLAKEKRDQEIAAEKEAAKKKALQEKAKREAEAAAKAEEKRKEAEAKARARAVEQEQRQREAEAKAKEKEAAAAKAKVEKEAADKARAAAKEQERKLREERKAFDFEGVSAVLKDANYVNHFRDLVTAQGVSPYVARDEQVELARRLLAEAKEQPEDRNKRRRDHPTRFPGFMSEFVLTLAIAMQKEKRRINKKQEEEAQKRDSYRKAEKKLETFAASVRSAKSNLWQLLDLAKQGGMNPAQHDSFVTAIESLVEVLEECRKAGFSKWAGEAEVLRAVNVKLNGKHHKLIAHLGNANEGERHNAADALHKAARAKGVSVTELLGLE